MVKVFDFFSGCGGTSLGFKRLGFDIVGALDFDQDSATTYQENFPDVPFFLHDIRDVLVEDISSVISNRKELLLFCGCAPCQPFSGQRKILKKDDPRRNLLSEFQRFIEFWKPEYIFLENVPGLQNVNKSEGVFKRFTDCLDDLKYTYNTSVVKASDFGVPQIRKRFILVAAAEGYSVKKINDVIPKELDTVPLVRNFIGDLPPLEAGERHVSIPNHVAAQLSEQNLLRIRSTPEGGDRRDWPDNLRVGCHADYKGHIDVYGRMKWDAPASTLTTKCISYSNGRFGHPEQDRAISLREAARLQTFPDEFVFTGALASAARQIGNAVPPLMAEKLSECFM